MIRDNTYGEGGNDPQGRLAPLAPALGGSCRRSSGMASPSYGGKTEDVRIAVREKPEVGFINLGLGVTPPDLTKAKPSTDAPAGRARSRSRRASGASAGQAGGAQGRRLMCQRTVAGDPYPLVRAKAGQAGMRSVLILRCSQFWLAFNPCPLARCLQPAAACATA